VHPRVCTLARSAPRSTGNDAMTGLAIHVRSQVLAVRGLLSSALVELQVDDGIRDREEREVVTEIVTPVRCVQVSDRKHTIHRLPQKPEEELLCGQFYSAPLPIAKPRLRAEQYGYPQRMCRQNSLQGIEAGITV